MPGSSRIDGEDPRRPEAKLATATAPQGAPSCVARRGGRGGRGGSGERVGEARGGRWPRQRRAAAVMALGCARERAGGEEEARESAREVGAAAWRLQGIQTRRGEGRQAEREVAWRGGARACRARARPPVGEEDDRGGGQVGWAGAGCCWAAQGGGPGNFPSFIFVF